jgi:subtilase family serine protease
MPIGTSTNTIRMNWKNMEDNVIPYSCPAINKIQNHISDLKYDLKRLVFTDLESKLSDIDDLLEEVRTINHALRDKYHA